MLNRALLKIETFILGGINFSSHEDQKRALLLGQLSILSAAITLVYIIVTLIDPRNSYLGTITTLFSISILVLFLNRKGKFTVAAFLLALSVNGVIFYLAFSQLRGQTGQIYFILVATGSLAIFSKKKILRNLFVFIPVVLFAILNFTDIKIEPRISLAPDELVVNFYIDSIFSFFGSILIVNFLIRNNERTENKLLKNEEELLKTRKRYELAIKGSRAGIWEWDVRKGTVYNSPVWKAMLGYNENELQNMTLEKFLSLVHPDDREKTDKAVQDHLNKKNQYLIEFRMIRKDRSVFWVLDSGQAVWDENGSPVQMVGSIVDITERKEAEDKIMEKNNLLAKANAELDRFVYSASHDLRSPLSSITGLINLAEKSNDIKETAEYLAMMKSRIKVLEEFIREIISYSQNARLEVAGEIVNLYELANESVKNLKFSEEAEGLNIEINCPSDFDVFTDPRRLRVVLNNLLGNSIKYKDPTKEKPWVQVEAKKDSLGCEITVRDNGIGIKKEHLPKIFNMFYRAAEKSDGSGLGLYIVKETLSKIGGRISVESEYGKGSTFKINLSTPT